MTRRERVRRWARGTYRAGMADVEAKRWWSRQDRRDARLAARVLAYEWDRRSPLQQMFALQDALNAAHRARVGALADAPWGALAGRAFAVPPGGHECPQAPHGAHLPVGEDGAWSCRFCRMPMSAAG